MLKSTDDWLNFLEGRELPVLRRSIEEIARLARKSDKVTTPEIAKVIHHDPLLTLKILRFANRPRGGRFDSEITMVTHAVVLIGVNPLFKLFSSLTSLEETLSNNRKALAHVLGLISRSYQAAFHARDWAILRKDIDSEEVYVAALLRDIAEVIFAVYQPKQARLLDRRLNENPDKGVEECEIQTLGFKLGDLRLALANHWHLPPILQTLIDPLHADQLRVRQVLLATSIAHHSVKGWYGNDLAAEIEALSSTLRQTPDETAALVHNNAVIAARAWRCFNVTPTAAWLPMLPGNWPPDEDDATNAIVSNEIKFNEAIIQISAHSDGTLNLHDMMDIVLHGMHEGIGMDRVVFALMTSNRKLVKAKYVLGEHSDEIRHFQFDLSGNGLFSRLMTKIQSIWLNDGNRPQLQKFLYSDLEQSLANEDFFAMSIFVRDRPIGLFYADRKGNPLPLTDHEYQEFKQLCQRAIHGLAHLAKP